MLDRYRAAHAAVWPEMLRALEESGWHNYSLFLCEDGTLIGYFESESPESAREQMAGTDVNRRWQQQMAPFFGVDGGDDHFEWVEELFNLEDQLVAASETRKEPDDDEEE